ncbi:Protein kinase C iota type, partial [Heterocephalus glaber]
RLALILGRDIMTRSFENSIPVEGLCDKDQDVWCLDSKQLFTTDWNILKCLVQEKRNPSTTELKAAGESCIVRMAVLFRPNASAEGHIKVTDYCVCKEGLQPEDTTSTYCGTPNYLAPEVVRGEDYSFAVDWWALGVLMYEMMIGESPFHLDESSENSDQNSHNNLLYVILERDLLIPRCLSLKAASVLESFLNRDPKEQLCGHPNRGFADVQEHPFFQNVNWHLMEQKQVVPPFKPNISGEFGLDNFDPQFTNEPVQLTPENNNILTKIDGYEVAGFEYINRLSVYEEEWV